MTRSTNKRGNLSRFHGALNRKGSVSNKHCAQFGPSKNKMDTKYTAIDKPWQIKNHIEFRIEKGLSLETSIARSLSKPEQEVLINKIV